jgi:hypothetical protein
LSIRPAETKPTSPDIFQICWGKIGWKGEEALDEECSNMAKAKLLFRHHMERIHPWALFSLVRGLLLSIMTESH